MDTTTRRADPTESRPCSVASCNRAAVAVESRRTAGMPAAGYYPVCKAHLELPSARAALLAGLAVHELGNGGWAIYPTEFGYDLYPGGEGPQRDLQLHEALDGIAGDQSCRLAPAGCAKWPTLDQATQQRVLDGECPASECPAESAPSPRLSAVELNIAWAALKQLVASGVATQDECRPVLVALENELHRRVLESL